MRFTAIAFNNIVATDSGRQGKPNGEGAVNFDCDNGAGIVGGNCGVSLNSVHLLSSSSSSSSSGSTGSASKYESKMECNNTYGTATDLVGLSNCLNAPPRTATHK